MRFYPGSALAIAVITFLACEATLRVTNFMPQYGVTMTGVPVERAVLPIKLDDKRLFRLLPSPNLKIGENGYRGDTLDTGTPDGKGKIAVVGDSIPMGMAVHIGETLVAQLKSQLPDSAATFNYSIQGYGPDQSLIVLEEDVLPHRPETVVFMLYPENDFGDLLRNRLVELDSNSQLLFRDQNAVTEILPTIRLKMLWSLLTTGHFLPSKAEKQLDQILFQDKLTELNSEQAVKARQLLKAVLQRAKQTSSTADVNLLVVIVPGYRALSNAQQQPQRKEDYLSNEKLTAQVSQELGIRTLDLTELFFVKDFETLYTKEDLHLSVAGHRLVAEQIAKELGGG